jgi:NAD-dependent SIR2 family protein deacetylase
MIIVNKGPTHLDEQAAVIIREDVATALPAILKQMERTVAR